MHTQVQTGVEIQSTEEYLRWNTQDRISDIERGHKRSELSNVIEWRELVLRCGDDDGGGIAPPPTPGIPENASQVFD